MARDEPRHSRQVSATTSAGCHAGKQPRLLDQVRLQARVRHLARSTERAYVARIREFILFHGTRHPAEMSEAEVNAYLTWLAAERHVAASTQNQALSALLFLYDAVLQQPLDRVKGVVRARRPKRLPTVLTREEVERVIENLRGERRMVATLLYGAGLRLMEALRLRVKDIDLQTRQLMVREAKGAKDRVSVVPDCLVRPLAEHLRRRKRDHGSARAKGEVAFVFRTHSPENIHMPTATGPGSGCLQPRTTTAIVKMGGRIVIMFTKARSSGPSPMPFSRREFTSVRPATPCDTPLRRIC